MISVNFIDIGCAFISGYAMLHGSSSQGKPMSEVEQQAAIDVFDDKDVKDSKLSDGDGVTGSNLRFR